MATIKILDSKDYRKFILNDGSNRRIDEKKHRKLLGSMKKYGFLPCFPIVVYPRGDKFVIKEGQHRFTFAESLGIPFFYVVSEIDFDVAEVNCTAKSWTLKDYAYRHADAGLEDYAEGISFAEQYSLPFGAAFAMLYGSSGFDGATQEAFYAGRFKVKDRDWANSVAVVYNALIAAQESIRSGRLLEACMAVCRVKEFDTRRLLQNVKKCIAKLVAYTTRDSYLDMLEEVYNFGRAQHVGLKALAVNAMRERNSARKKKAAEEQPEPAVA